MLDRKRSARIGRSGEDAACRLVRALGMKLLVRNFRYKRNEIDIVALDGEYLCFIEVKTQIRFSAWKMPRDKVSRAQKLRIARAGAAYMRKCNLKDIRYRYDIIEIVLRPGVFNFLRYAHYIPGAYTVTRTHRKYFH